MREHRHSHSCQVVGAFGAWTTGRVQGKADNRGKNGVKNRFAARVRFFSETSCRI